MFIQAGYNTLLISPECSLDHAYTIGWVIGKSVFYQVSLPLQVSKLLLQLCLGKTISLDALEDFD